MSATRRLLLPILCVHACVCMCVCVCVTPLACMDTIPITSLLLLAQIPFLLRHPSCLHGYHSYYITALACMDTIPIRSLLLLAWIPFLLHYPSCLHRYHPYFTLRLPAWGKDSLSLSTTQSSFNECGISCTCLAILGEISIIACYTMKVARMECIRVIGMVSACMDVYCSHKNVISRASYFCSGRRWKETMPVLSENSGGFIWHTPYSVFCLLT